MTSRPAPSAADQRRWRRHLADERLEAATYRRIARRRDGEEREILLALAEAESRHAAHWEALLEGSGRTGEAADRSPEGGLTRSLSASPEARQDGTSERARRTPTAAPPRGRPGVGSLVLALLARHIGSVFVLALAERAEKRSPYEDDVDATPTMAADERVHAEVVRALAARGRARLSGTFRAAVFGANDGLVSNLALVLGVSAAGAARQTVLVTALAGLLAGALSMAAGEFVSVRSQRELLEASAAPAAVTSTYPHLDVDANELALVYRARGMSPEQAQRHAAEQLGGAEHDGEAFGADDARQLVGSGWSAAASSFLFFATGAAVPALPFVVGLAGGAALVMACVLVAGALLLTGAAVGLLSGSSPLRRAGRQLAIGAAAAAVTYGLGLALGASVG